MNPYGSVSFPPLQVSPSTPPPASTTGGGFVEFEGDATVIKTGEMERVDVTFTPACGDTFKESDPDGTVKCGWVRQGSTDLTASSTSIPPGDCKFTMTGSQCPPSVFIQVDWIAVYSLMHLGFNLCIY